MVKFLREFKMRSRQSGDETCPVSASRNGKPLGHRNVTRRGFEPAAKHGAISGVIFHSMRHAFASRMIDRGIFSTVPSPGHGPRVEHDHGAALHSPLRPTAH